MLPLRIVVNGEARARNQKPRQVIHLGETHSYRQISYRDTVRRTSDNRTVFRQGKGYRVRRQVSGRRHGFKQRVLPPGFHHAGKRMRFVSAVCIHAILAAHPLRYDLRSGVGCAVAENQPEVSTRLR